MDKNLLNHNKFTFFLSNLATIQIYINITRESFLNSPCLFLLCQRVLLKLIM